jgi:hypothetical protein
LAATSYSPRQSDSADSKANRKGLCVLPVLGVLSLTLVPRPAHACKCEISFGACRDVGASDFIFIGTVQSIEPIFLDRWDLKDQSSPQPLNDVYTGAQ